MNAFVFRQRPSIRYLRNANETQSYVSTPILSTKLCIKNETKLLLLLLLPFIVI